MKSLRKLLHIFIAVCMVALFVLLVNRLIIVRKEAKNERTEDAIAAESEKIAAGEIEKYDAIVVPGASVNKDRTPSAMLKNRLDTAIRLWKMGVAEKILVTGDHRPGEYDEVDVMWEYLVVANVPEEVILRDYAGFSTYESMYHAAVEYQLHRIITVTQQYHLYRAMYIADSWDVEVTGVAAENVGNVFGRFYRTLREIFACVKDINYCYQKKEI